MDRTPNEMYDRIISPTIELSEYGELSTKSQSSMRKENILIDVVLKCGDVHFPAHRVILATHSPYFRAMFTLGMKESSENVVELQGEEPAAILRMLDYIYSGNIDVSDDPIALLGAAELLQVDIVSKLCCNCLFQSIFPNKFQGVWNTMEKYAKDEIINMIVVYLASAFTEVCESKEFLELSHDRLLSILKNSKLSAHPDTILSGILKWAQNDFASREQYFADLLTFVKFTSLSTAFLVDMIENEPLMARSPSLSQKVNAGLSVKLWKRTKVVALLKVISSQEFDLCCLNVREHCQYFKLALKPDSPLPNVIQICSHKNTMILITESHVLSFNLETRRWTWFTASLEIPSETKITCAASSDNLYLFAGQSAQKFDLTLSENGWQAITFPALLSTVASLIDVDGALYAINSSFIVQRYNKMDDKWSIEDTHHLRSPPVCALNRVAEELTILSTSFGEKVYLLQYEPSNPLPFTLFAASHSWALLMERKLPSVQVRSRIKAFHVTESGGKFTVHLIDSQGRWWSVEEDSSFWKKNGSYVGLARSSTSYRLDLPEDGMSHCRCPQRNVSVWEYDDINGVWIREISFTRSSQNAASGSIGNETRNNFLSWKTGIDHVDHAVVAEMHID